MSDGVALPERMLDRCNPILVREVQQAVNGRAFLLTVSASICCVTIIAMVIAASGSASGEGLSAFIWTLTFFVPVALFIVPFQAFLSTRHEVSGGTAEHLLLTRLRPGAIVRGKLLAAMVQYLVYLSIFAPLIALTFLLRGVDVPSIAFLLGLCTLASLCATAFSVLLGASSASARARTLPYILLAVILGGFSLSVMGAMQTLLMSVGFVIRRGEFWKVFGALSFPVIAMLLLFSQGAAAQLTHAYENRSTPFRLLSFAAVVVAYIWIWLVAPPDDDAGPAMALIAAAIFFFFWLFSVTEEEQLSPRMKTRVPRRSWLAALSVPFLPGGGRGMLHSWMVAVAAIGGMYVYSDLAGVTIDQNGEMAAWTAWMYVMIYASMARLLRGRLASGERGTRLARVATPAIIFLLAVLPTVFEALADQRVRGWHTGQIFNPFWTIEQVGRSRTFGPVLSVLALTNMLLLVFTAPAMGRGIVEVRAASRARRAR
ncbi:MAG: hypothetical protein AAGD14_15120 [Planctomycetota bacterium]